MQTFLPYPSFERSAQVLDRQRLGKQRVEAMQLLRTLDGVTSGWAKHPATAMWRGCEDALAMYGRVMCWEWISRGYKDSLLPWFSTRLINVAHYKLPTWFGNEALHGSHRSNLLRKFPEHYRRYFPDEPDDLPYVWLKNDVRNGWTDVSSM